MKNNNGVFKGMTQQHLKDIDDNICEIRKDIKSLNKRYWVMLILLVVAVVERAPALVDFAFAK